MFGASSPNPGGDWASAACRFQPQAQHDVSQNSIDEGSRVIVYLSQMEFLHIYYTGWPNIYPKEGNKVLSRQALLCESFVSYNQSFEPVAGPRSASVSSAFPTSTTS